MKVNLSLVDADTINEYHENGVCVVRNLAKTLPEINLTDGESIHGELFPLVWPR